MNTTNHSSPDPLIDEVRQRRRELYARYGNNLKKLGEAIQQIQAEHPDQIIDRRKQKQEKQS